MDYYEYDVEDFVADESFQAYVAKGENKEVWESLKKGSSKGKIEEAEKLIKIIFQVKPDISEDDYNDEFVRFKHLFWQTDMVTELPFRPLISKVSVFLKIGAIFLVITGLGYYFITNKRTMEITEPRYITKYNPAGQKSTIFLNDGSSIVLNSDSRIGYPEVFTSNSRSVTLEGEAFFKVVSDARPFEVITGNLKTIVIGTTFNIHYYDKNEPTISLASGKVIVMDTTTLVSISLYPGQKVNFKENEFKVEAFDAEVEFGWKNGEIVFYNADMEEVINRLERWYGVTIEINNGKLRDWNVKGRFQNESLRKILESLSFTQGFNYTLDGKRVVIF
jgi:transmembrane sensor